MIAYLKGIVLQKMESGCVVLTDSGVGYEVGMSAQAVTRLGNAGDEVALYVQTIVREDALALYGFATWEERELFRILIGVPKLGPKTAMAMLSCFEPGDLAAKVAADDVHALTRVPGIGAKSAKRIVLDLKDKLSGFTSLAATRAVPVTANRIFDDTLGGLFALGYSEREASPVVRKVLEEEPDLDVGGAIRAALKLLSSAASA
ncbi:Holliday junction branch migration protein RuvA [Desulfoplanes formicivorans]|uniref:Holliday junction branch migration complex subunit RuvA n=1 Tax=Desulfoplanes formicivorans TaxID=1592317 RepID=A0A194AB92_9BACT|nr:Holliday junction branch migration protein RuvA [Desulfoplanes formicivorans]GAU07442.1 Holliday junction DNA helicase RuvA [Desulfoplanes formicivorans]